jgi:tripartite-type tricarboxylate transporter receptor subunit TctC
MTALRLKVRRLISVLVMASGILAVSAAAQDFPTRPVKLVVAAGAGSVPDSVARPLAEALAREWAQTVVVENRPGAGGIPAMEGVVRSQADGYTVALATMSQLVFNPSLYRSLPYDPARDLIPITQVVTSAQVVAVHPSFPVNTLAELIAHARGAPQPLQYAVAFGSPPHITALRLWQQAGVKLDAVPFRTGPEALTQTIASQMPIVIDGPATVAAQVNAGRLRALAVTGPQRLSVLADVPTAAEQGVGDAQGESWMGIVAPAGTAKTVIQRWHASLLRALASPSVQDAYQRAGMRAIQSTPEEFEATIQQDRLKWGSVIQSSGLKLD